MHVLHVLFVAIYLCHNGLTLLCFIYSANFLGHCCLPQPPLFLESVILRDSFMGFMYDGVRFIFHPDKAGRVPNY